MFRSLRWTLLFWYLLILAVVIGGFGGTVYYITRQALDRETNARLQASYEAVAARIAADQANLASLARQDELHQRFRGDPKAEVYYVVWRNDGSVLASSQSDVAPPTPPRLGGRDGDKPLATERGWFRELHRLGPQGTLITVGQRTDKQWRRQWQFLAAVFAGGGVALALGACGGWFLVGRALNPIRRISQAAQAISAANLSQRVDASRMKSELGQLASILNDTFDRLESAFQRQAQFTADASHELRTPLAVLTAQADLALRRDRSPERYRETIELCLQAGLRMTDVVTRLLTLARCDAGQLTLALEKLALGELVQQSMELLQPLAAQQQVTLTAEIEPVTVAADGGCLRQVVDNLLTNAIQYNRPGGRVDVRLTSEAGAAVLTVSDTGVGIPAADLPHVFERFYRVDKARSRAVGGSGLGLSICRRIVHAHGGEITCSSEENCGTTFVVRLPLPSAVVE
jgi:heavy metal sensor kinase